MPETKIDGYQCLRCEHKWVPREDRVPVLCPSCRSAYWNIPKREPKP